MKEVLLSTGIDIGTSTTQLVFSHITIENLSSSFSVPRVEIVDKKIVFRSDVFFTPLLTQTQIDMNKVRDIVEAQYVAFGVQKQQVKTGAVLITGETARKENASEVLLHLSDFAGDFVVATAGPDLESIIAGRGAGADLYSKKHLCTSANFDIGGGTSNFVLFKDGEPAATGCLDIGGRLVKVDADTRKISYVAPKIQALLANSNIALAVGDDAEILKLKRLCKLMTQVLEMSLGLREKDAIYKSMLSRANKDIPLNIPIESISFSGGVADYIYGGDSDNVFRYGDVGILLGRAIKKSAAFGQIPLVIAAETIRATVVGAGSHVIEISGSTIEYDKKALPIKNMPIVKLFLQEEESESAITIGIRQKLQWHMREDTLQALSIAIKGMRSPSFLQLQEISRGILKGAAPLFQAGHPLVVVVEHDIAKALGQALRVGLPKGIKLVCIDAISVANGDYVDIGQPVAAGGAILPVVVKTLVFQ